uniref:Glycosyl hydrolase family 38 C-terminal domain-containing protein n=1 Tax=Arion vulgaris TaxID=1028688 RepID=A0A0B7BKR3_9EUPU
MVRVIKGPITSEVHVITPFVHQVVRLHNSPGTDGASVDVYNIVDIRQSANLEVGMRIHTDVDNSQRIFYSDLNGFQMQQRKYYHKLTLQGNVYPMPTMAYLQDKNKRVSVLSAQSAGVANLVPGAIDVMFDRRLNQDDNRGLGQGVLDNHPTPSRFRLLFESRLQNIEDPDPETSFPSLLGHLSSLALIHPIFVMPRGQAATEPNMSSSLSLLTRPLSCELHLLNVRTLQNSDDQHELQYVPKETSLLLLRHLPSDCSFLSPSLSCTPGEGKVKLSDLFSVAEVKKSTQTSLTMNKNLVDLSPSVNLQVEPMEIMAIQVHLS